MRTYRCEGLLFITTILHTLSVYYRLKCVYIDIFWCLRSSVIRRVYYEWKRAQVKAIWRWASVWDIKCLALGSTYMWRMMMNTTCRILKIYCRWKYAHEKFILKSSVRQWVNTLYMKGYHTCTVNTLYMKGYHTCTVNHSYFGCY